MREQDAQPGGLQLVEARVVADLGVEHAVLGAVGAKPPGGGGELVVVGDDRAPVAEAAQVLGGEEAEGGGVAERSGHACRRARAGGLRGVLEHAQAVRLGELAQLGHRRRVPVQVDRAGAPWCASPIAGSARRRGHVEGPRVDVAEDRRRAGVDDRLGGRVEGERGHDDLVAGADAEGPQRDRQRVGAVGDADAVAGPEEVRELGLEGLDLGPEDVAAGAKHRGLAVGDLLQQGSSASCGREQRESRSPASDRDVAHRQRSSRSRSATSADLLARAHP